MRLHVEHEHNPFIKWVNHVNLSMTWICLASTHNIFINGLVMSSLQGCVRFCHPYSTPPPSLLNPNEPLVQHHDHLCLSPTTINMFFYFFTLHLCLISSFIYIYIYIYIFFFFLLNLQPSTVAFFSLFS